MISEIITNMHGQSIELRYMEDYAPGDLDVRVFQLLKKGKEEKGGPEKMPEGAEWLTVMRNVMGYPNKDVTHGEIQKEEIYIEGSEGKIRVLKYAPSGEAIRPCMVFFHGGGFFGGTTECVENPCKALALYADAVVLSVDYRLAPEHPYPAGFHDNYDVVKWAYEQGGKIGIDSKKIGVCGDSAGGNMAAACALRDRKEDNGYISFQAMLYPTVNMAYLRSEEYVWDLKEYEVGSHFAYIYPAVMAVGMEPERVATLYLGEDYREKARDMYVSPILAKDVTMSPPALIINAEYDYLRLEGEAYGRKLAKAGVPVRMVRYCGMDHAFMDKIGDYPQAEDAMKLVAEEFLKYVKGEGK